MAVRISLAAFPFGGDPMVSWVLVPIALVAGALFGVVLVALVSAERNDDQ